MMTDQKYKATQAQMLALGLAADKLDCLGFLERVSTAETLAPVINPSLFQKASQNMEAIKQLALAFQQVKTAMEKLRMAVVETGVKKYMAEQEGRAAGKIQDLK